MDVNLPDIVAEVRAAFARYEAALMRNDTGTLQSCSGAARTPSATA